MTLRGVAPLLATALACWLAGCAEAPSGRAPAALYEDLLDDAIGHGLPGFALIVDRPGREPWAGAAGYADVAAGRALTIHDPFHLASVTKSVTAVTALRLFDRGLLALDDRIVEWLDESTVRDLPAVDRITVRHLLEHRSGLYSYNNDRAYWSPLIGPDAFSGRDWSTDELLGFARSNPPAGPPGAAFHYADTNYVLLGELLEQVAGEPFKSLVRREVFEPLGMESAYFFSDYRAGRIEPSRRPVEGYLLLSEVIESFGVHPDFPRIGDGWVQATDAHERSDTAAGAVASPTDMLAFARALFRDGFLSETAHELLRAPLERLSADEPESAGVLWAYLQPYGALLAAEGDGPGGVHTLLAHHPETDTLIVAFTNSFGRFDERDFVFDRVVAKILR